jgi:hypothetical protein
MQPGSVTSVPNSAGLAEAGRKSPLYRATSKDWSAAEPLQAEKTCITCPAVSSQVDDVKPFKADRFGSVDDACDRQFPRGRSGMFELPPEDVVGLVCVRGAWRSLYRSYSWERIQKNVSSRKSRLREFVVGGMHSDPFFDESSTKWRDRIEGERKVKRR